ncbi:glutamine amidotransferase [Cohaesibacter celericrescens]|uniref:Glutamine amidotransferase n=1 Tax=Cohaesibacter celericrescens TaxID=2067669 RepID=A0A2N5XPE3_9HYPH|nr:glutamine amidotransferase [Cohaesibacter celericrescens]PLW76298.1 glutamine amidotransferase [Cohaesibacter celericrescens]
MNWAASQLVPSDAPRILIILHQENSIPGRVGWMLKQRGFKLDIRRPRFGDSLPQTMDGHAGAVVFGGPMSANDKEAYIKREIDWISVPLRDDKPFLGICLGGQMLAKQLGGHVTSRVDDHVEIGYYPIEATNAGQSLLDWPSKVYQWHREGFSLPKGAELLATGASFANQAMRYGNNAYGIQFHPEVTMHMMHRWTVKASERLKLPGARSKRDHFQGRYIYDPAVEVWLDAFLDLWVGYGNDYLTHDSQVSQIAK